MTNREATRRVVLLARPGAARDRVRAALAQAGADVVLEADPTACDPATVTGARPEVALVVLDSATDEALNRFDAFLSDPKLDVFFEEAELAIAREGWDAARWVRHLSAKLRRSDNVLPPDRQEPAPAQAAPVPAHAAEAVAAAAPPPSARVAEPPPLPPLEQTPATFDLSALELSPIDDSPVAAAGPAAAAGSRAASPASPFAGLELEPVEEGTTDIAMDEIERPEPIGTTRPASAFAGLELESLDDGPATAISIEGLEKPESLPTRAPAAFSGLTLEEVAEPEATIVVDGLELEVDSSSAANTFRDDMAELRSLTAGMELTLDNAPAAVRGAVLVLAGIGGPDAVRQLLGALPAEFPRPVLIQQRLDGGHYDKLVAQMQRATTLAVKLAIPGDRLEPTTIYILPPTVGVQQASGHMEFTPSSADLVSALPAGDSAVLMLSGSDVALVDAVMKASAAGALVGAQSLDGCYDATAPAALAARGGRAGRPQELARRLAERWH